jgi:hypothetical protein
VMEYDDDEYNSSFVIFVTVRIMGRDCVSAPWLEQSLNDLSGCWEASEFPLRSDYVLKHFPMTIFNQHAFHLHIVDRQWSWLSCIWSVFFTQGRLFVVALNPFRFSSGRICNVPLSILKCW